MSGEEKCFEDVLKNNFSPAISDVEKTFIYSVMSRLKWIEVDADILFDRERGPEIMSHLMTQINHRQHIIDLQFSGINTYDFHRKQELVICIIAKLCFYYWIRDSEIVLEVLKQVYSCSFRNFSSLFEESLYCRNIERRSLVYQDMKHTEYLTMLYFLTHAHRAKLEFFGERFVDLRLSHSRLPPVIFSVMHRNPEMLLLLLRHGAKINLKHEFNRLHEWKLNAKLQDLIMTLWYFWERNSSNDKPIMSRIENDTWLCLRFLLRGIRQIPMGVLDFSLTKPAPNGLGVGKSSHDFIRSISERNFLPSLMSRYLEPSGLQHLCRMAIRDVLNKKWDLPFGIFRLPLPKVLQRYVNLAED